MDVIDIMIYFFLIYVILVIAGIIGLFIIYPIYYFIIFGDRPGIVIEIFRHIYVFLTSTVPDWTKIIFFLVTIFFLIMYVIYKIIMIVVPDTGFITLFIPLKELLLAIPPLPKLRNKGVFNVFDRTFQIIGNSHIERFKNYYFNYLSFFKDNFYDVIKLFNPKLNMDKFDILIENMNNYNKESEKRNINNDINICINNNSTLTTPNMSFIDLTKNTINDIKANVKCNLNALPTYISTSE